MQPAASILVIDDDLDFRGLMVDVFSQAGYETAAAASVDEARQILSNERFSLIVTDLRMPEKNGLELVHWLRREGRAVPIIVISGFLDSDGIRNLIRQGVAGVFTKPINLFSLLQKATELIQQSGNRGAALEEESDAALSASVRAVQGESQAAKAWQTLLQNTASFTGCLTLRAEAGIPVYEVCQDLVRLNPEEDRLVYVSPATLDDEALGQLLADNDIGPEGCLTLAVEQADALQDWQQDLLVMAARGEGSLGAVEAQLRLVAAVSQPLETLRAEGLLEPRLLKLLSQREIIAPTLRELAEDIPVFAQRIWTRLRPKGRIDVSTHAFLKRQSWPGNMRQLHKVLQVAATIGSEPVLGLETLREALRQAAAQAVGAPDSRLWRRLSLRRSEYTQAAYLLCGRDAEATAEVLQVHPELVRQIIAANVEDAPAR
ncbi:MAG: putative Fis family two component sigma-54 specific transcriptional regulator [Puniceicoccaceae bacterium 5H]|nr:MAG: putative Fis family two component sigma-54 specific transcriptional regulator [Puniceicoccaceae bacterium 5H]